jgi:hypothetical protein
MGNLTDYEITILRMLNGETVDGLLWGAAMSEAIEALFEGGYVTRRGPAITYVISERGRRLLDGASPATDLTMGR